MAERLNFLTHSMGGTFYNYLDTATVGALCAVNRAVKQNVETRVTECQKMGKRPYPRSAYFEDKWKTGFISYTDGTGPTVAYVGYPWRMMARPCNPKFLSEALIIKQGKIVDPYVVILYDNADRPGLHYHMTKHEALAIRDAFKWWLARKRDIFDRYYREAAAAEAAAAAEEERKKKTFLLRTSGAITNPWKKV